MKKIIVGCIAFGLILSGCGGQKKAASSNPMSVCRDQWSFMEDGIVGIDREHEQVGYFDYKTKNYMPLCARANCRHDSPECQAVHLARADFIGRIGDKWYYYVREPDEPFTFYSSDLDGGNERKIGEFPYSPCPGTSVLFYSLSFHFPFYVFCGNWAKKA